MSPLRILGRRWLAIVVVVIVGTALGLILAKRQAPRFEATARVFLSTSATALGSGSVDATRVVQTQARFASSTAALDLIAKQLGVPRGYVADRLKVTASDEGYFFTIVGRDGTEAKAVELVRSAEASYQQLLSQYGTDSSGTVGRLTALRDSLLQAVAHLQAQQAATSVRSEDQALASQIGNLNSQIADLNRRIPEAQVNAALSSGPVTLAEAPRPVGQVVPQMFRDAFVGALAGFFLAVAAVWGAYLRRPTALDGTAAANAVHAPLIARIPPARSDGLPTDTLVAAMAAVLSPTAKVVALTPAAPGDLGADLVATVAANWSDDQGVILILDASPQPDVRATLERMPRPVSGELPRWAHEPTCLARSSGTGRGHLLYNRVAQARAARPGGLAPILADRAPAVDLVILLTPALTELPITAASAMQADAIIVVASGDTPLRELAVVPREWLVLSERIVGVVYDGRPGFRRSAVAGPAAGTVPGTGGVPASVVRPDPAARDREAEAVQATDRYARPGGGH